MATSTAVRNGESEVQTLGEGYEARCKRMEGTGDEFEGSYAGQRPLEVLSDTCSHSLLGTTQTSCTSISRPCPVIYAAYSCMHRHRNLANRFDALIISAEGQGRPSSRLP